MIPMIPGIGLFKPAAAGAPADPHRYYKLVVTQIQNSTLVSLSRLGMFDGTDYTTDRLRAAVIAGTVTITASSTFSGFSTASIADGSDSTAWAGNTGGGDTIFIDLGSNPADWIDCHEIEIRARNGFQQGPRDFSWQHSDNGSAYTSRFSVDDISDRRNLSVGAWPTRHRTPSKYPAVGAGVHRRWGIKMKTGDGGLYHLKKIELRNTLGGASRCTGGLGTARSQWATNDNYDPHLAWEGSFGSPWVAYSDEFNPIYAWYEHADGQEQAKPAEIALQATTSFPNRMPRTFDLVWQDYNGGPITVQESFATPAWSTADEIRLFTVA